MKHWSLRRTLLLTTNLMVMVILALGAWFNYRMTQHELNEVFDAELAQTTRLLKSLIQDPGFLAHDGSLRLIELPPLPTSYAVEGEERQADGHPYERKLAFQVWNADGELVVASQNAKPWHYRCQNRAIIKLSATTTSGSASATLMPRPVVGSTPHSAKTCAVSYQRILPPTSYG